MLLDTETDDESPVDEELMSQIRENPEVLFLLLFWTGASGTLTSDPPNDTTGWCVDTAAGFTDDEHNGHTIVFLDGTDKGSFYTIDDTEAANNRVECAGDNLYSAGVRSGDPYIILYDIKANSDGHDHDWVNSKGLPRGYNMAVCHAVEASVAVPTPGTDVLLLRWHVYIPQNARKLHVKGSFKTDNASYSGDLTVIVRDVDTDEVSGSDTTQASHDAYQDCLIENIDVSSLDPGWGQIDIEADVQAGGGGTTVYVRRLTMHWD